MSQLPPKSPTITSIPPNWPNFDHERQDHTANQPSWVDDFLDFSSVRRGSHRRSVSDSVAFLEAPSGHVFDHLNEDQFFSMFSAEAPQPVAAAPPSSSAPSTPSDQNSFNDDTPGGSFDKFAANEMEEAQSASQTDSQSLPYTSADPKRVKRILANRQSAQRSRVRKLQYISELERNVTTLQTEVSALSPRVAFLDHQRSILTVGNNHLKQRIAALAQDKIFMDAHQEALRNEIERLRQVYHRQNLKEMAAPTTSEPAVREGEALLS